MSSISISPGPTRYRPPTFTFGRVQRRHVSVTDPASTACRRSGLNCTRTRYVEPSIGGGGSVSTFVDTTRIDDAELCAEALAADPDTPVGRDAVPLWELAGRARRQALPHWYMPAPMCAPRITGWRRRLVRWNVGLIIASFLAINAAGLCNTYGELHL
jgi:hypothetical protein